MKFVTLLLAIIVVRQSASPVATDRVRAEEIIERAIQAKGGREAILLKQIRRFQGFSMLSDGTVIRDRYWVAQDGRYYYSAFTSDRHHIEAGSDGETIWTIDGDHQSIYDGERRAYKRLETAFEPLINYKELCTDWRVVGDCEIDGESCDRVRVTAKQGGMEVWSFERGTHLLVQIERTWVVGERRIGVVGKVSDYREVDGVLIPFLVVQSSSVNGNKFEMRTQYTTVTHDPSDVHPLMFDLPPKISELRASKSSSQPVNNR